LPPRPDVEFFYAAADAYVGPSLEDAFAQPPAEAMASGLPVITSRQNGGAEIISHGSDGLILEDPEDVRTLAEWIRNCWRMRFPLSSRHERRAHGAQFHMGK